MADYSGYYTCGECGVDGDHTHPAKHKPTCSVPENIARAARERQLADDARARHWAETVAEFEDMADDQVITQAKAAQQILDDHHTQMKPIEFRLDAARQVIRQRPGLLIKFLDR